MSAYILYQNQTIPEKWGDSLGILELQKGHSGAASYMSELHEVVARPTTELTALQLVNDFRDRCARGLRAILLSATEDVSEQRNGV